MCLACLGEWGDKTLHAKLVWEKSGDMVHSLHDVAILQACLLDRFCLCLHFLL
jgi:hypothetical protein